jgi:cell division protein FtsB
MKFIYRNRIWILCVALILMLIRSSYDQQRYISCKEGISNDRYKVKNLELSNKKLKKDLKTLEDQLETAQMELEYIQISHQLTEK